MTGRHGTGANDDGFSGGRRATRLFLSFVVGGGVFFFLWGGVQRGVFSLLPKRCSKHKQTLNALTLYYGVCIGDDAFRTLLFADDDHHPLLRVSSFRPTKQVVQTAVEQLGYSDRSDVTSLILDDKCTSHDIEGLDGFENLKTLSLIKCGIASLADLPNLPELRKLNVSQNRISNSGMMRHVAKQCPKLEQLIVCDNPKLTKVEEFTALTELKRLQRIDAEGCNFEEEDHARLIFEMFPEGQMQNVDGYNEKGEEVYSDSEDDSEEEDVDDEEEEDVDDEEEDDDVDDEEDDEKPAYAALVGDAILSDDDEDAELSEEEGSEDFEDEEDDEEDDEDDDEPAAKKAKQ